MPEGLKLKSKPQTADEISGSVFGITPVTFKITKILENYSLSNRIIESPKNLLATSSVKTIDNGSSKRV